MKVKYLIALLDGCSGSSGFKRIELRKLVLEEEWHAILDTPPRLCRQAQVLSFQIFPSTRKFGSNGLGQKSLLHCSVCSLAELMVSFGKH